MWSPQPAQAMEPFVQKITAGGLVLVAGLWIATLGDGPWTGLGWGLVVLGLAGLGWGIGTKIDP